MSLPRLVASCALLGGSVAYAIHTFRPECLYDPITGTQKCSVLGPVGIGAFTATALLLAEGYRSGLLCNWEGSPGDAREVIASNETLSDLLPAASWTAGLT